MGVGVQGESGAVVTKHTLHRFDIYSILECQGRKRVPKLVEAENEAILVEVENGT